MSKIDPVSTVAVLFLLVLIALTSWARAELPTTVAMLGEAATLCPKATGQHRYPALC